MKTILWQKIIQLVFVNIVTGLNMVMGLFAIGAVKQGKPELAVYFICAGLLFDFLDGKLAKLFDVRSKFGSIFDSISDTLTFGIAPLFLFNFYYLQGWIDISAWVFWIYGLCAMIRFGRHDSQKAIQKDKQKAFRGLPIPAAAIAVLAYLQIWLSIGSGWFESFHVLWVLFVSALMLLHIPFQSPQCLYEKTNTPMFWFKLTTLIVIFSFYGFWVMIFSLTLLYLLSNIIVYFEKPSHPSTQVFVKGNSWHRH